MRNDNYMYFTDILGNPTDVGSECLNLHNKLPRITNLELNIPYVLEINNKFHILMPIRGEERVSMLKIEENLRDIFKRVYNILREKQIKSISMAESKDIELLPWASVLRIIKEELQLS